MYGAGATYDTLTIDAGTESTPKNKTAIETLARLVDPKFIFWATYMRIIYTLVYRPGFDAVQYNHHHSAPQLAGPDGLPTKWAAAFRSAVVMPARKGGKLKLNPEVCAPLLKLLERHTQLGGEKGALAQEAAQDFLDQAGWVEHYFERWASHEKLPHAMCLETVLDEWAWPRSSSSKAFSERVEQSDLAARKLVPCAPAPEAIKAAQIGLDWFAGLDEVEQIELSGTLTWRLFSPKTREGSENPVYFATKAFAAAEINSVTGQPFPYRCWHELAQVLIAGGAKYCPVTSAQLESMFTGLTRQQGASKLHISQIQISYESRSVKNGTMPALTELAIQNGWPVAKKVKCRLDQLEFWVWDLTMAANRHFRQKLNEKAPEPEPEEEVQFGFQIGNDLICFPKCPRHAICCDSLVFACLQIDEAQQTYEVERIVSSKLKAGKRFYVLKWKVFAHARSDCCCCCCCCC